MKKGSLVQMSYAFPREVYPHSILLTVLLNQGVEHVGSAPLTTGEVEMRGTAGSGSVEETQLYPGQNWRKAPCATSLQRGQPCRHRSGVNSPVVHPL